MPDQSPAHAEILLCDYAAFVRDHAPLGVPSLIPELKLHLAAEVTPLWLATEAKLNRSNLPPPYWAFAWPGGQAVARLILDQPERVRGRHVLDFAAGSGVAGLAAAQAGARRVCASEIDPFAIAALALNAAANGATLDILSSDVVGTAPADINVILAGDVCYERPMAQRVTAWLRERAAAGVLVLLGDPGRAYVPGEGLELLATVRVPTSRDLEDRDMRETNVWRLG